MKTFDHKKAIQAIAFIGQLEGGVINYMKAIKLIWLSDRYFLRNHGRTITGDIYFALKDGPVASCSYDLVKSDEANQNMSPEELEYRNDFLVKQGKYDFGVLQVADEDMLSESEITSLRLIYAEFGGFDQFALSELSHKFPEWQPHEEDLLVTKKLKRVQIDMRLFFKNADNKLFINSDEEIDDMIDYSSTFYPQMIHAPK